MPDAHLECTARETSQIYSQTQTFFLCLTTSLSSESGEIPSRFRQIKTNISWGLCQAFCCV